MSGSNMLTMTQMLSALTWVRTHRALIAALGLSVAMHIVVTIGTPIWFAGWHEPKSITFSAVLNPLAPSEPTAAADFEKPTPRRSAPKRARDRAPESLPAPKSQAAFTAPENAIAVERPAAGDLDDAALAALGGGEGAGAGVPAVTAGLTPPPVKPEIPSVVAETPSAAGSPATLPEAALAAELPSRVSISYNASTSVADGVARYSWKRDGDKYTFESTISASGFFVDIFVGTITQKSTGMVTAAGIEPSLFSIRRGNRAAETVEFMRATKEIRLSRGTEIKQLPMPQNLQDTQSFLFQLAIEAAKLRAPEDRLNIEVTNARGLNRYTFKKVGVMILETRLGPVETLHLVRETSEPRDGYEVWLSPKHHYLPIKLKFFLDRFPAELIATTITSTP